MSGHDRLIFTTDEQPYPHYGMKSYRIERDVTGPLWPFQRHVWTTEDGRVRADEWINSIYERPEVLVARGYSPFCPFDNITA